MSSRLYKSEQGPLQDTEQHLRQYKPQDVGYTLRRPEPQDVGQYKPLSKYKPPNRIQLRAAHTIASTTTSLIPDGGNSRWSLIQSEQQSEVDAELITVSRSDKGTNFYHYPRQAATRKVQDVCQTCKNYHSKRAMSRARFPLLASTPT